MTAVIGRSRHVTGYITLRLVGGRIQDLDRTSVMVGYKIQYTDSLGIIPLFVALDQKKATSILYDINGWMHLTCLCH